MQVLTNVKMVIAGSYDGKVDPAVAGGIGPLKKLTRCANAKAKMSNFKNRSYVDWC